MFKISRKFRHINESKQFYFWFSSICGGSDIDSPDWIRKKLAAINSKIEDDKCIQYATTVALNYKEIKWNPERVSDIKLLLNKYDLEKINYPSNIDDWKRFEKNNPTVALNILCTKEKEILPAYISNNISSHEKHNSLNDSKRRKRRMALSCSKRIFYIIKRNNIKTSWGFLLPELHSFL